MRFWRRSRVDAEEQLTILFTALRHQLARRILRNAVLKGETTAVMYKDFGKDGRIHHWFTRLEEAGLLERHRVGGIGQKIWFKPTQLGQTVVALLQYLEHVIEG